MKILHPKNLVNTEIWTEPSSFPSHCYCHAAFFTAVAFLTVVPIVGPFQADSALEDLKVIANQQPHDESEVCQGLHVKEELACTASITTPHYGVTLN